MAEFGQDFTIWRGEDRTLEFLVPGQAGAVLAYWYLAANRFKATGNADLALSVGNGITLEDSGDDLLVKVTVTKTQSASLPLGLRHHELWLNDTSGQDRLVAEGRATINDSVRA